MRDFAPAGDLVRAFVAVAIDDAARGRLADAQERLRKRGVRIGWVAPANIHVTLAFLGDIPPAQADAVSAVLDGAAARTAPFAMAVAGLGWFGSRRAPRVVWAGVTAGADALVRLQARVAAGLGGLGLPLEARPFTPHLTLARVRPGQDSAGLADLLDDFRDAVFGTVAADRVLLMRSELQPRGPVYAVLHAAALTGVSGAAGPTM
jgi:RNA 2',3'-cyclic 3'-phosphodiesterase